MTMTTWGSVVGGDLVLDPATEQVYLVTGGYTHLDGIMVDVRLRYGKQEFEISKPASEPVEVTAHSERTAVDGMVKVTQPGFVVDNDTGETSPGVLTTYSIRDEPTQPAWMPQVDTQRGAPLAEINVGTTFVCEVCGNRTPGIMHQRLHKTKQGDVDKTYCTWPCGHEVKGNVEVACFHPSHESAVAEADAHYGQAKLPYTPLATPEQIAGMVAALPPATEEQKAAAESISPTALGSYVAERLAEAAGKPIDFSLLNPPVVQDPETVEKQDAEAAAVQAAFGEDKVEMIASETVEEQQAREAATMDDPLILPAINDPLSLRSHLYLLHDVYVAELDPGEQSTAAALQEHHRKAHEDGPMVNPHLHREA